MLTIEYYRIQHFATSAIDRFRKLLFVLFVILFFLLCCTLAAAGPNHQAEDLINILLTEVYYDTPAVDAEQEWVELSNFGVTAVDLSDYKLGDEEASHGTEGMLRFPKQSIVSPGQTIIVAQSAHGFSALYGRNPDYEIADTDPLVPDMRRYILWSTGSFALANDGDELLLLDGQNLPVDAINYGDKKTYFDPSIGAVYTGNSIERVPASCDTDSAADWQPSRYPSPGIIDLEGECASPIMSPGPDFDLPSIGQIQGAGDVSPFVNQHVEFHGVVTGTLEDRNSAGITFYTLFVQDIRGLEDDDPETSDGMAIFLGRQFPSYRPGDILHISGQVTEFFGLTEIDDQDLQISIESRDNPLPDPVLLDLSHDSAGIKAYLESYESMLVTIADPAQVVGPTHSGCGFALIDSHTESRPNPLQRTEDQIKQPILILHNSDVDCRNLPQVKTGDLVSVIAGPLVYHFDQFKIVIQDSAVLQLSLAPWSPLPQPFVASSSQITVATFNLNNHFDGAKDMPASAEPVVSANSLEQKQKKLAAALSETLGCPTIIGIQEVENDYLLQVLVNKTAVACGFTYDISHRESSDSRGLDLALLTDPRLVEIVSIGLRQACTELNTGVIDPGSSCSASQSPLFGRPPLQVELKLAGSAFTVYVNHFKSKREGENETSERRLQQSRHMARLVEAQLAMDPQAKIIVMGDFNDFELSPTMLQMTDKSKLTNTLARLPLAERYSYIFDGVPQLIDGILVSPALLINVADVMIVHANADYPIGLASASAGQALTRHASDHDVPLLLLDLASKETPTSQVIMSSPTWFPDATQAPAPTKASASTQALTPPQEPEPSPISGEGLTEAPAKPDQVLFDRPLFWLLVVLILVGIANLWVILRRRGW